MPLLSSEEQLKFKLLAGNTFSPSAPINDKDLFAGRIKERHAIIDAICQRGQHAIIYGERGVGKTSLANMLSPYLEGVGKTIIAPHVNCDSGDTFSKLWRKVFNQIFSTRRSRAIGFTEKFESEVKTISDTLTEPIGPEDVRNVLQVLGNEVLLVIIIDEFDRLPKDVAPIIADTIKMFSDYSVPATVILVGVADSVMQLVAEHASIERALVQVQMPRMSDDELGNIVKSCLQKIGMTIDSDASAGVCKFSHGLPHYTHLLGQYSAWDAIENGGLHITHTNLNNAIRMALENTQQTIRTQYHKAIASRRRDSLYKDVLYACALTKSDSLGYFAAADIRDSLREITQKNYQIPAFSKHLHAFCAEERGQVLERIGQRYTFRFRFRNPLLQPYVIMRGVVSGAGGQHGKESNGECS